MDHLMENVRPHIINQKTIKFNPHRGSLAICPRKTSAERGRLLQLQVLHESVSQSNVFQVWPVRDFITNIKSGIEIPADNLGDTRIPRVIPKLTPKGIL